MQGNEALNAGYDRHMGEGDVDIEALFERMLALEDTLNSLPAGRIWGFSVFMRIAPRGLQLGWLSPSLGPSCDLLWSQDRSQDAMRY